MVLDINQVFPRVVICPSMKSLAVQADPDVNRRQLLELQGTQCHRSTTKMGYECFAPCSSFSGLTFTDRYNRNKKW